MELSQLRQWGQQLGFATLGVADLAQPLPKRNLEAWLEAGAHGDMHYMAASVEQRSNPALLVPNATRAIMVSMNYKPRDPNWLETAWATLSIGEQAYVARYALGRDYHKIVRGRLQKLMARIAETVRPMGYRVFSDSAPIMEVELAQRAGLGWRGKHTLLLSREQGSLFFIGTVLTDYPFEISESTTAHCGQCTQCIDVCPTQAITSPYQLDARRCISYLTIEHHGSIDPELRPLMGNRIYGCDDCQLVCPWNKFAQAFEIPDFAARNGLDSAALLQLFCWTEDEFLKKFEGSPIRRIGHERWLRNLAIALGNLQPNNASDLELVIQALEQRLSDSSELVREHIQWALDRLQ
jgi:epoxyqueuosine reductase